MHSQTPQDHRVYESPNSDESGAQTARSFPEHNWSATQAMLAAFLLFVVVVVLSQLL